ncbi:OLC1v1028556C1 [Oldenlandia corymbosa var. corymbosa]|uniref:OLC1v1028556C1 n=1 Tax=Oldenlandia corymbosa var. corymbosa TaxID=529605 RepID=A0AAV1CDU5_OLDCO|nr:OLC1v1028556C1 [Oldenlandia corymbosa var. corymbosa]
MEIKQEESSSGFSPELENSEKQTANNNNACDNVGPGFSSPILLDSDSDDTDDDDEGRWVYQERPEKRQRVLAALPVGFLDPLKPEERLAMQRILPRDDDDHDMEINPSGSFVNKEPLVVAKAAESRRDSGGEVVVKRKSSSVREFWKAGDYELSGGEYSCTPSESQTVGIDHVRVHPKFLHSNATSHKWALGAFAELLDNAMDEVPKGATYVNVDVLKSKKYHNAMLMVQDNGGGMTPDDIRRCMSLGYSAKSKLTNTIGQYGNGFKTSTMRLGADVIVFSRCGGKDNRSCTQSIGMLSYSFLMETGKADIVVPMIDFMKKGDDWDIMIRSSLDDWNRNLDLISQWSPYETEEELLQQVNQGTRIIIYNLWEDEQGSPELDFDSDEHDIQIRGVNRDEKKIQMAKTYPNIRHYLTYRHSLRHYAAMLYLRIPPGFRIILRGKDVKHYNVVNDLMHSTSITYCPKTNPQVALMMYSNVSAELHIGFIKDAQYHLDVQGFNVYHKNRLIKPLWRVWNPAGSDGRGVIGIIEANFVQPAHDKQGFERTTAFDRLETRLITYQKNFWSQNCHKVGYSQRVWRQKPVSAEKKDTASPLTQVPAKVRPNLRSDSRNDHRSTVKIEMTDIQDTPTETQSRCVMNCEDNEVPVNDSQMIAKLIADNNSLEERLDEVLQELQRERERNQALENNLREEREQRDLTEQNLRNELKAAGSMAMLSPQLIKVVAITSAASPSSN